MMLAGRSRFCGVLLVTLVGTSLCGFTGDLATHTNSIGMKFVRIPAGTFTMGDGKDFNNGPPHAVTISRTFYLGAHEVTQEQFKKVLGFNPSWLSYKAGRKPVDSVSWLDTAAFCRKLGETEGRTYRLPTEAEWEYACRAGTKTQYFFGDSRERLGEYAWHGKNCSAPMEVGTRKPTPWGLYDMLGNVYEWVSDWYADDSYTAEPVSDPAGPKASRNALGTGGKVARGGCWLGAGGMNALRTDRFTCANRNCWTPYARHRAIGFRVVLEIGK